MKRFIVGVLIGLLLAGAMVLAQGEWQGQQWEYLYLIWDASEDTTTINYLVSNSQDEVKDASFELFTDIYADFLIANDLSEVPDAGMTVYVVQGLGERGWELVTVNWVTTVQVSVFKRPKP